MSQAAGFVRLRHQKPGNPATCSLLKAESKTHMSKYAPLLRVSTAETDENRNGAKASELSVAGRSYHE